MSQKSNTFGSIQSIGMKTKRKQFHASKDKASTDQKEKSPSIKKKREQSLGEFDTNELRKSFNQLLLDESLENEDSKPKISLPNGIQADLGFNSSWKAKIAHESRKAVVKILNQLVSFDWIQPFKHGEEGEAIGTGFFISEDGLIVTNGHVIRDGFKLYITIPTFGEEKYEVRVVGVCFDVDLALLKVVDDIKIGKFLELGDSNSVQYGQEVLALGYPLGMESLKLTEGIISGRQDEYLQTSAPLNPGNSGGPLLNDTGKVIGINVSIIEKSQGVGFSIPVYQLQMLLDGLKNRPPNKLILPKPILGAEFNYCDDMTLEFMGLDKTKKGLYVKRVYSGFPLYNAGVREGDILHSFNNFELDNFGQATVPWNPYAKASIESLVDLMVLDSTPEIVFSTNGQMKKATIDFKDPKNPGYPYLPVVREFYPPFEPVDYEVICGAVFMNLTLNHLSFFQAQEQLSEQLIKTLAPFASFGQRMQGALVMTDIFVGSSLAKNDIFSAGTIISKVNDIPVSNLTEFREAIRKPIQKGSKLYITIMSKENELAILSLQDAFREEVDLSETFHFQLSSVVLDFLAKSNESQLNYITRNDKRLKRKIKLLIEQLKQEDN